ncbi:hypothetical protein ACFRJ9_19600 [Paenarthrobacter sp. NPDC056912]|uniref:hypothetical protein n=1 Tax=Paenarthrobacter sp. NPDC056912 TaxID=3345965 RepID=UPI003671E936
MPSSLGQTRGNGFPAIQVDRKYGAEKLRINQDIVQSLSSFDANILAIKQGFNQQAGHSRGPEWSNMDFAGPLSSGISCAAQASVVSTRRGKASAFP